MFPSAGLDSVWLTPVHPCSADKARSGIWPEFRLKRQSANRPVYRRLRFTVPNMISICHLVQSVGHVYVQCRSKYNRAAQSFHRYIICLRSRWRCLLAARPFPETLQNVERQNTTTDTRISHWRTLQHHVLSLLTADDFHRGCRGVCRHLVAVEGHHLFHFAVARLWLRGNSRNCDSFIQCEGLWQHFPI